MADEDSELLMILDENGNSTGKLASRYYVHKNKLFHNEVSVFIFKDDKVLLEKRSYNKRIFPGKLCVPGGHVIETEELIESAIKEVFEEVGLTLKKEEINFADKIKRQYDKQNCFQTVFYTFTTKDISYFKKQNSEVEELIYMEFDTFLEKLKKNDSDIMYNYNEEKELFDKLEKIIRSKK